MIPVETKDIVIKDIKEVIELSNSRIAGLILYDRTHPHVSKVVNDTDYWNEFNDKSGMNWGIFVPSYDGNSCSVPSIPESVLDQFDLTKDNLPCFVILSYDDRGEPLYHSEKIDDSSVECAHESLNKIIEIIAGVEDGFLPENKQTDRLYPMVKSELDLSNKKKKFWKVVKNIERGVDIVVKINGILMMFQQ